MTFTVRVATAQRRQPIEHFGASGCWTMDPLGSAWDEGEKERVARLLFSRTDGIGLSCWRVNLGAGSDRTDAHTVWHPWRAVPCVQARAGERVDLSRHAGQFWFLRAAKRHGVEKSLAFVNSPPVWLTKNGHAFCDAASGSCNLPEGAEGAYARFLGDAVDALRAEGLAPDYLSPVNEPNWDWKGGQEGCRYSNADVRRTLAAVRAEFARRRLRTELDACDSGDIRLLLDDDLYREYSRASKPTLHCRVGNEGAGLGRYRECARDLLGDPAPRETLGGRISGHSYWTADSPHDLGELRRLLQQTVERHSPGGRYWQTEFCVMEHRRDLGMDTALRVAAVIHADLVHAEASAWHWWLAVSPGDYKDGLIYTDFDHHQPEGRSVLPSKTLWALGNWSRFLRPGSRRVEAWTDALPDDLLASAYLTADGRSLVCVLVNPTMASAPVRLVADAQLERPSAYVTDATRDLAPLTSALPPGEAFAAPPRSVTTLVVPLPQGTARRDVTAERTAEVPRTLRERPPVGDAAPLYVVRCGGPAGVPSAHGGGRRNSRDDQTFGSDPGTGYRWGWLSHGGSGARRDGGAWGGGVRWDEGDTAGEGLTYRFEVAPGGSYTVELALADPWDNRERALDVWAGGERRDSGRVAGTAPLVLRYEDVAPGRDGLLEVRVVRAMTTTAPAADALVAGVRVFGR